MLKPFLKWAGGKTQLKETIISKIPFYKKDSFNYVEPFIGGGAILFEVINVYKNINKVLINDINSDLINSYKCVIKNVYELVDLLKSIESEYHSLLDNDNKKKEYYYLKRSIFNKRNSNKILQTALLIFLNKTCFNGLYRVNNNNEFNVPIGSYKRPKICDEENLENISKALVNVKILNLDFEKSLSILKGDTFFYIDPPYKPISKTARFNSYSLNKFDDSEQFRLKNFCDKIEINGDKFLLSNSCPLEKNEIKFFDVLYKEYIIKKVLARRQINSVSKKRGKISELLISNF